MKLPLKRICSGCGASLGPDKEIDSDILPEYVKEQFLAQGYAITNGLCKNCMKRLYNIGGE